MVPLSDNDRSPSKENVVFLLNHKSRKSVTLLKNRIRLTALHLRCQKPRCVVLLGFLLLFLITLGILRKQQLDSYQYASPQEEAARSERFPSVDERVRIYMTSWYPPPCSHETLIPWQTTGEHEYAFASPYDTTNVTNVTTHVAIDDIFVYQRNELDKTHTPRLNLYTVDTRILESPLHELHFGTLPLLLQFGDSLKPQLRLQDDDSPLISSKLVLYPTLPVLMKVRPVLSKDTVQQLSSPSCVTRDSNMTQQILIKLESRRHYDPLQVVGAFDRPWSWKSKAAIFRGSCTGWYRSHNNDKVWTTPLDMHQSDRPEHIYAEDALNPDKYKVCMSIPRCRLAYLYANSKIVNAKLVAKNLLDRVTMWVNGTRVAGLARPWSVSLSYKGIIMVEGNDLPSGLKWALFSNSVVLMPPPTVNSWAMEELLEPWVHYIPLKIDMSDVEEQVQWMVDHDEEAQAISRRATLFVKDLHFHKDAASDDEHIYREILQRYQAHFEPLSSNP